MARHYLARCDACGALALLDDEHARDVHASRDTYDPAERFGVVGRCALVHEMDTGEETCSGTVLLVGMLDVAPIPDDMAACTGVMARWCPVHGTCTDEGRNPMKHCDDPRCPLHGAASAHGGRLR